MSPKSKNSRRYQFISSQSALLESLAQLDGSVAIDTEFHAEHRYEPTLMLIQLADATGDVLLVDAQAIDDLKPIGEALSNRTIITHAGHHDVPLLMAHTGLKPSLVIDVQVLAGFSGLGYPKRLEELEHRVLNIAPAKSETLSDWSRRPLRNDQLQYAAADVANLHLLYNALKDRACHPNLAQNCSDDLTAEALNDVEPSEAWRGIIGARVLNARERGILKTLCEWREITAQERNQKVHQVASPSVVLDLSRRRPKSVGALRGNRMFPRGVANRFGDELLEQIAKGEKIPKDELPESVAWSPIEEWAAASLLALGHKTEVETGVAAKLLFPQTIVSSLVGDIRANAKPSLLGSWREGLVGSGVIDIFKEANRLKADNE